MKKEILKVCETEIEGIYRVYFKVGSQLYNVCRYDAKNDEITSLIRGSKQYTAKSVLAKYDDLKEMIKTEINN